MAGYAMWNGSGCRSKLAKGTWACGTGHGPVFSRPSVWSHASGRQV
jgi:hypothetical protein